MIETLRLKNVDTFFQTILSFVLSKSFLEKHDEFLFQKNLRDF